MRTKEVTKALTPTEAAVLGLLGDRERSGYDLLKGARASVGYFWSPAKSQLYSVLPRLVEAGLASSRTVLQTSKPDKQLYRITRAGREALARWVDAPATPEPDRNPLLLQLFLGDMGHPAALLDHVRRRRQELEQLEAELQAIDADPPRERDFYQRLTRRYGLAYARALIDWAKETERELEREAHA